MGMELQLRQSNFDSFSTTSAQLGQGMDCNVTSEIIGTYCVNGDAKDKEWFVKLPELTAAEDSSSIDATDAMGAPEKEQTIQEYMQEPSQPVRSYRI